jgi:hypothetical protein
MMTDDDVASLYRCLLGRAPEGSDTVAAFKAYYGDFPRGRAAILQSAEFSSLFAEVAGVAPARVALGFARRAGGAACGDRCPADAALAGGMRLLLRGHERVHLCVVVGEAGVRLSDLLPLETARAAVLHVAPDFPPFLPQIGELAGGGVLFRVRFDAASLADFLAACDVRIDVLAVMGDAAPWLAALRRALSDRAILLGDTGLAGATEDWPGAERMLALGAWHVRMMGGWFLPVRYAPPAAASLPAAAGPSLWLAAIMRNEQDSIVNMLRSVAPIVAGFVLVDTGSVDDTMSHARAYLEDLGKPFQLQARAAQRFDDMRNAALDLVPPEAGWVLMLDADEELCAEDFAPLLAVLNTGAHDAYALPRYNYPGIDKNGEVAPYPDRQVRLLRHGRVPPVRYSGAVHEKVRDVAIGLLPLDAAVLGQGRGGPHIHHLVRRFRSPDAEAQKQERYRAIAVQFADAPE